VAPFGGPLLVQVNGARYAIGRDVAAKILVGK
jgi:Fe2+ transport system protein FeoA